MTTDVKKSVPALRLERDLKASPDRVYAAWTQPAEMKLWCAPPPMNVSVAEVDLRVGGRYRIAMEAPDGAMHVAIGEYRAITPGKRLEYTWRWESWRESHADSLVTVEFKPKGTGTNLVITHTELPDEDAVAQHRAGWEGCLVRFVPLVEGA